MTESGDLYSQRADGILGLGRGPLSVVDQLIVGGAIASTFSMCYGGMDEDGGAMILGAVPPIEEMVFTPSNPSRSSYYNVVLEEIWVGGELLPVNPSVFDGRYGTILDSGSTFAYSPEKAFNLFKDFVKSLNFVRVVKNLEEVEGPGKNFNDVCYAGAGNDLEKLRSRFPSIDFVFGDDVTVSLAAENYLFRHTKGRRAYCLGFYQNEDSTTILGGIVTRNMLVTYDRANDQIGFLRTKCTNLWMLIAEGESQASIPPLAKAGPEFEWYNPPMPLSPPIYPGGSSPEQEHPQSRPRNHTTTDDMAPKKDLDTSNASPHLSLLFYVPFMARCLRPLHVPLIVIFITGCAGK